MVQGTGDLLAHLSARLDGQDRLLAAQEAELAGLRAEMLRLEGEKIVPAPITRQIAPPARLVSKASSPRRTASATRRTLLKGAGAALFTTALLATGEVIPIAPLRVAAADPPPRPSGTPSPAVVAPDTRYQTLVGTDFQPEITTDGYTGFFSDTQFGAGLVSQSTGTPANFSARVDLPQGATIIEVIFYVLHNDANLMFVDMGAADTGGGIVTIGSTLVLVTSAGAQAISLPSLTNTTVDNGTHSYVLEWFPHTVAASNANPQQLYGARVAYTLPGNAQVYGSAQAGVGVRGDSATGTGVIGNAPGAGTVAGVLGSTNATLFTDQRAGVAGMSDVAAVPALYGHATVGDTNGVTGIGANGGVGVYGQASGGNGVGMAGLIPGGSVAGTIAVYGANGATAANSHGVIGLSSAGHGVVGVANSAGAIHYAGIAGLGANGANAGDFYGDVAVTGMLNGHTAIVQQAQIAVAHPDGSHRLTQAVVSPEGWMEDFGKGTLANGQANIKVDPAFAALAEMGDYHVFLTAHGDYNLHVAEMKADGFVVGVTDSGTSTPPTGGAPVPGSQVAKASNVTGAFSWRVAAKRKDGQTARLATYTFPKLEPPHIPDLSSSGLPKKP